MSTTCTRRTGSTRRRTINAAGYSHLLGQLAQEWQQLTDAAQTRQRLTSWIQTHPALPDVATGDDLLAAIDDADLARRDAILAALVAIAHDGDQLAGRVLVQAFLPGLISLAAKVRHHADNDGSADERLQHTIATFWEVLTSPATRRLRRKVAAGLHLNTLHALNAPRRRKYDDAAWVDRHADASDLLLQRGLEDHPHLSGPPSADTNLENLLLWARDTDAITPSEVALLAEIYLADTSINQAAATRQLKPTTLRRRCDRARTRLAAAVHTATTLEEAA